MNKRNQDGFSIVELLLVCVIAGIIAAMAIPALQKAIRAAENGTTFATMRTIASTQVNCYSQRTRFCRLDELQGMLSNGLGTTAGDTVVRGRYVFEMSPTRPDDTELSTEYTITATRSVSDDVQYIYEINQSGYIEQVAPMPNP